MVNNRRWWLEKVELLFPVPTGPRSRNKLELVLWTKVAWFRDGLASLIAQTTKVKLVFLLLLFPSESRKPKTCTSEGNYSQNFRLRVVSAWHFLPSVINCGFCYPCKEFWNCYPFPSDSRVLNQEYPIFLVINFRSTLIGSFCNWKSRLKHKFRIAVTFLFEFAHLLFASQGCQIVFKAETFGRILGWFGRLFRLWLARLFGRRMALLQWDKIGPWNVSRGIYGHSALSDILAIRGATLQKIKEYFKTKLTLLSFNTERESLKWL